ncbi:DUF4236 domain-containing protein [Pseudonocardia sp. TRM90224]|uniref:DUF4236 domain-containing protein n=1 Tax=Pseudonocardia sp. TRM90224 TaxID=2812678 RepID=UPI001E476A69|nr:DUF4236 domain-containing protein [Pseudonocardia sp. TRM90224]
MRYRMRKSFKLGPIRIRFTERGYQGWGLKIGRWSWDARSGVHSVDTPGLGGFRSRGRRR